MFPLCFTPGQLRNENQRLRNGDEEIQGGRRGSVRPAELKRQEALYHRAQDQISELHNKLKRQRDETVAMEQQLIALRVSQALIQPHSCSAAPVRDLTVTRSSSPRYGAVKLQPSTTHLASP